MCAFVYHLHTNLYGVLCLRNGRECDVASQENILDVCSCFYRYRAVAHFELLNLRSNRQI